MSNFFVSQPQNFVSIYIAPTIDLTTTLQVGEKGVVASIGKIPYGNPNKAVIINTPKFKKETTKIALGGSQDNEALYHYEDFFSNVNGKLVVGRVLGVNSTTTILEVEKEAGEYIVKADTNRNIFGADGIKTWGDVAIDTAMIEILITSCIADKHSIKVTKEDNEVSVKLYDRNGNSIYSVSGGFSHDSINDYGQPNFIGNLANPDIIEIKTNPTHADKDDNFSAVKVFNDGLVVEVEDDPKNYDNAINAITPKLEQCDYYFTAGLVDVPVLKKIKAVCFEAKVMMAIDVVGDTLAQAITYKSSLNMNDEYVYFVWNEGKDVFSSGALSIGLSGFFIGATVRKNLSILKGQGVENRLKEGVAGVDYPLARTKKDELTVYSKDDMNLMVKERINTLRHFDGTLCIGDILSGNPKKQATALFPVTEGKFFIDRYIANIIKQKFFKNLNEAKRFVNTEVRRLFATCLELGYFDTTQGTSFTYKVSKKEFDTIVVEYAYIPEGITRKGWVQGTLVKDAIDLKIG